MTEPVYCPFCAILNGEEPGVFIAKDNEHEFALIENIHPEGTVHWMALPFEHVDSVEALQKTDPDRFIDLVKFAIRETKAHRGDYPYLTQGYTIKMHFGSYETVPHAKLHVLSVE